MKIFVIKSSPHRNGSSNLLADNFIQGAQDADHEVVVFDAGHADIKPCTGCSVCGMDGPCIQHDNMMQVHKILLESDMVVFVTPLYYYGFSSQMKMVIDRFYSVNTKLAAKHMKSALIVSAWDSLDWVFNDIKSHYMTICNFLKFENVGIILGAGCGTLAKTTATTFPQKAYDFGKSL